MKSLGLGVEKRSCLHHWNEFGNV